jgi:hypothetical protein
MPTTYKVGDWVAYRSTSTIEYEGAVGKIVKIGWLGHCHYYNIKWYLRPPEMCEKSGEIIKNLRPIGKPDNHDQL